MFNLIIYIYIYIFISSLSRDTSKTYVGEPFVPIKAIAVDMFPHTSHTELIIFFQKYSNELILND